MEQTEALKEAVRKAAQQIKKWQGKGINEAATRAAIIDPLLTGLGWDVANLELVLPEPVSYGKTRADYGLLSGDRPVIYVEAKPLDRALDHATDGKQAVDNANSDGVEWCVLTNGKDWWFYKSNAQGNIEGKMFHSVTVSPDADVDQVMAGVTLLERGSVERGAMKEAAEVFFVDRKVKASLDILMREPSNKFLNALKDKLGGDYTSARLKASLARIAGFGPPIRPEEQERSLPARPAVNALVARLDRAMGELPGTQRRETKFVTGYSIGRRQFAWVQPQKGAAKVFAALAYGDIEDKRANLRDVSNIGHWGGGDVEVRVASEADIDYALSIVRLAYERMKAKG